MCDICHMHPCPGTCPNADWVEFCKCDICGHKIYEGETYYELSNMNICDDCVFDGMKTAEPRDC